LTPKTIDLFNGGLYFRIFLRI